MVGSGGGGEREKRNRWELRETRSAIERGEGAGGSPERSAMRWPYGQERCLSVQCTAWRSAYVVEHRHCTLQRPSLTGLLAHVSHTRHAALSPGPPPSSSAALGQCTMTLPYSWTLPLTVLAQNLSESWTTPCTATLHSAFKTGVSLFVTVTLGSLKAALFALSHSPTLPSPPSLPP